VFGRNPAEVCLIDATVTQSNLNKPYPLLGNELAVVSELLLAFIECLWPRFSPAVCPFSSNLARRETLSVALSRRCPKPRQRVFLASIPPSWYFWVSCKRFEADLT